MTRQRRLILAAAALTATTAAALLTGCSSHGGDGTDGAVTLNYWLWDANQQPGYQKCTDEFAKENPGIKVKVTQYGWDDYWSTLTAGLVSGNAPDVFVDHLNYYPELASKGQILPLDDEVSAENVDLSVYRKGLADLWVGQDGKRYGLPRDYDTVAVFANQKLLDDAGITDDQLDQSAWNPQDGGSFEKIIAHLTVDTNGVRGDEPGFDKSHVATYGIGLNSSGAGFGQTEWSEYAFSNDWQHLDKDPWGTHFNYGQQNFIDTISWFQSLAAKGYMPTLQVASSGVSQMEAFGAAKYALVTEGSWNTKAYFALDGLKIHISPVPEGPNGQRASMFNGLADSVAVTTKHPAEAKKLAVFMASKSCEDLTAAEGIAFPAIESSSDISKEAFSKEGIDTSAFYVPIDGGSTYLAPVTDHWSDVTAIMQPTMDAIMSLKASPDTLKKAADQVNALFK